MEQTSIEQIGVDAPPTSILREGGERAQVWQPTFAGDCPFYTDDERTAARPFCTPELSQPHNQYAALSVIVQALFRFAPDEPHRATADLTARHLRPFIEREAARGGWTWEHDPAPPSEFWTRLNDLLDRMVDSGMARRRAQAAVTTWCQDPTDEHADAVAAWVRLAGEG